MHNYKAEMIQQASSFANEKQRVIGKICILRRSVIRSVSHTNKLRKYKY